MGSPRLREVFTRIDAASARGKLPVCVFDLDSTLFSTAPRNLQILREFAREHAALHPELGAIAARMQVADMGWNVHDDLARAGVTDAGLLAAVKEFWKERFFQDEYLLHDHEVPGAAAFVETCHAKGALIYYLTGRHVGGMEIGSVQALRRRGFPFWLGRCVLHLKPDFDMDDRAFKDDAIADIRSYRGEVVASFENEPGNANMFLAAFPEALHVLLLTMHSPGAEPPRRELVRTDDFLLR
ncbi:MAG: HAD family hydrolase [Planctomycetes bacterium]|nr:HAD family hydrolase [Planctomycetota bacterium]